MKRFFMVYQFITIDYLLTTVENASEFHRFVALTTGFSDQSLSHKRDGAGFHRSLLKIVTHLIGKKVDFILLVVPPPHPGNNNFRQWAFYQEIRSIYKSVNDQFPRNTRLVYLDTLFYTIRHQGGDVVIVDDDGYPLEINVQLKGNVYSKVGGSITQFQKQVVSDCIDRIAVATNEAKSTGQLSLLEISTREVQVGRETDDPHKTILRRDPIEHGLTLEESEGVLFHVDGEIGQIMTLMLVDSGATVCVFNKEFTDRVYRTSPGSIVFLKIKYSVRIALAVGESQSIDFIAIIEAKFSGQIVYIAGLIVPGLTEDVLLGGNFLLNYGANIDYRTLQMTLNPPGKGEKITVPLSRAARRFTLQVLDASEERIPELFVCDHRREFANLSLSVMQSSPSDERSELLAALKEKVYEAMAEEIITREQAEEAFRRLSPYIMVFRQQLGKWNGGLIDLKFKVTESWKVKKYGYPRVYQKAIDREIKRMLELGVIVKSNTQYVHPIVISSKSDGSIRICVDAGAFNQIVCDEHHDPPRIESFLFDESLGNIFSSFDFNNGFLQIPLAEESSKFLGIQINGETFEYRRLPFGTKVSGSVFNRIVRGVIFQGIEEATNVKVYVDDVKVQTNDFEAHLSLLEKIVRNVLESGMTLSLKKTHLFRPKLKFLGHTITDGIISKNFDKGEFFMKFEKKYFKNSKFHLPTKRSVQQLVGFLNWYSRFIPKYSSLVSPLLDLLSGGNPIKVDESHEQAYYSLKKEFFREFELKQPKFAEPFYLVVHFIENAMTGCIFQCVEDGQVNIITMTNCRLPDTVVKKPKVLQVLYAIYYVLKRYKDLLLGFRIKLGSKTLASLRTIRDLAEVNGVCAKWYLFINSFDIDPEGYDNNTFESTFQMLRQFEMIAEITDGEPVDIQSISEDESVPAIACCSNIEDRWSSIRATVAGTDHEAPELLCTLFEDIKAHQNTDPFCVKITSQIRSNDQSKFCVDNGVLYKLVEGGAQLLVVPAHAIVDIIIFFHEFYIHAGIEKTTALIKRQFYYKDLKRHVAATLSRCVMCKHNKISNKPIHPRRCRVEAKVPGEVVSVDIFGPLPLRRGGIIAVFVAIDRLSGFVLYHPLKSVKTESFVRAMVHVLDTYDALDIPVSSVLSDNARQFNSNQWVEFLHEHQIKPKFTMPYTPQSNPAERGMRDLGEKIRLCINANQNPSNDHSRWYRDLKRIEKTLNAMPKSHGYSPNQILGITELNPLPMSSVEIRAPNPQALIHHKLEAMTEDVCIENIRLVRKAVPFKFPYDDKGWAHVYCDGAVSQKDYHVSAVAVWVAQSHKANVAKIVLPGVTNNQAEIYAVISALQTAYANRVKRVVVHTDSAYLTDLIDEGLLTTDNQKFNAYQNRDWLEKLIQVIEEFGKEDVQIKHVPGHSVDFGNLEADYMAQNVIKEYRSWMDIGTRELSARERIWAYVANFKTLDFERAVHNDLISGKVYTEYQEGDLVAVRQHKLSQAYYGLTKKFFKRYDGEFIVIRKIGSNAYLIRDVSCNGREVMANVRQLVLIRKREDRI